MPRKPAEPSFCHISAGKAFVVSVVWARDSGISRRVKSWTLARSSSRSERVGGTKEGGCLDLVLARRMLVFRRDGELGERRMRVWRVRGARARGRDGGGMFGVCFCQLKIKIAA